MSTNFLAGPLGGTYELPPKVLEVVEELRVALNSYVCTVKYMKQSVNPEEWESHGDWDKLARRGMAAMSRAELLKDGG